MIINRPLWQVVAAPKGNFEVHSIGVFPMKYEPEPGPVVLADGLSEKEARAVCDSLNLAELDPETLTIPESSSMIRVMASLFRIFYHLCWVYDNAPTRTVGESMSYVMGMMRRFVEAGSYERDALPSTPMELLDNLMSEGHVVDVALQATEDGRIGAWLDKANIEEALADGVGDTPEEALMAALAKREADLEAKG